MLNSILSLLKEPVVITILIEILILIIAKFDKSNKLSDIIIKIGKALESK